MLYQHVLNIKKTASSGWVKWRHVYIKQIIHVNHYALNLATLYKKTNLRISNDRELYKSNLHLSLTSCVLYTYKVKGKIFKTVPTEGQKYKHKQYIP